MRALILSAGLGERLRPITERWAKPAVPFLNIPMLGFPLYWLETLKLESVVINTHYKAESIRDAVAKIQTAYPVQFVHEPAILGSGGGIRNARAQLETPNDFLVANGDAVVLFPNKSVLEDMLHFHRERKALATLLTCPLGGVGTKIPGVWFNNKLEVSHFGLEPKSGLTCQHYASYMILSPKIWQFLPVGSSNILYDVLQPLIKEGEKVVVYPREDMRWFETGNSEDYLKATGACMQLLAHDMTFGPELSALLSRFDSTWSQRAKFTTQSSTLLAPGMNLPGSCISIGFAVIGENAKISPGVTLQRVVVLPDASVTESKTDALLFS